MLNNKVLRFIRREEKIERRTIEVRVAQRIPLMRVVSVETDDDLHLNSHTPAQRHTHEI